MIVKVLPATVLLALLVVVAPAGASTYAPRTLSRKAVPSFHPALFRAATNAEAGRQQAGPGLSATASTVPWGMPAWLEQKVIASDGVAGTAFGFSVAMDGQTAIVGSPAGGEGQGVDPVPGAAYIVEHEGDAWNETQILLPSDGAPNDEFGYAVAIKGDLAVVGAQHAAPGGNESQGEAYIFTRSNGMWSQSAALVANDGQPGDEFGLSVATDGSRVLVGAPAATFATGAVYVFEADGQSWTQTQKLIPDDSAGTDTAMGFSLAVHGDGQSTTVLAGATDATIDGNPSQGTVYVFDIEGDSWQQTQQLLAPDGAAYDGFGFAIAYDGVQAVVGAPTASVGGRMFQGAAYVFENDGGQFVQTQKLVPNDPPITQDEIGLGFSASLDDGFLYLGAPFENNAVGEAYQFQNAGDDGWVLLQKVTASDAIPGAVAGFGFSCAASNGNSLISQPASTIDSNAFQGAAYFYTRQISDRIFADGFDAQ